MKLKSIMRSFERRLFLDYAFVWPSGWLRWAEKKNWILESFWLIVLECVQKEFSTAELTNNYLSFWGFEPKFFKFPLQSNFIPNVICGSFRPNLIIIIITRINLQKIINRVAHLVFVLRLRRIMTVRSSQRIGWWTSLAHLRWWWRRRVMTVARVVPLHSTALLEHHLRAEIVHRLGSLRLADLLMVILLLLLMVHRILTWWWWCAISTGGRCSNCN